MVDRGLLRGAVSERYLDPRSFDISAFKSSSLTSVNSMSNLSTGMSLGPMSRGPMISHNSEQLWKFRDEGDGVVDNGDEDIALEWSQGSLRVGARGCLLCASVEEVTRQGIQIYAMPRLGRGSKPWLVAR